MRKYRARRTELGRELNRSKGSRNEESGKGRMDSGHKRKGETKWSQEYTAQRGRTPRSKHGMEMRSWRHLYHFLPDLEDDKVFWHLHELEKVLKLGQVVAAFQTQKQFFCWASHCNTFRFLGQWEASVFLDRPIRAQLRSGQSGGSKSSPLRMVNGGQRNLGMAVGAGLLWLADSMLQVLIRAR